MDFSGDRIGTDTDRDLCRSGVQCQPVVLHGLGPDTPADIPCADCSRPDKNSTSQIVTKLFEIPKIIHTFARFFAEACFFYRKSLRQGTINNV